MLSSHLKSYYINTRYITEQDQWPPEQPKHFTPLVLVHQEGQRSKQKTIDMASATMRGDIDHYILTTSSKTTKNLQDIFSQLEQSGRPHTLLVEGSPGMGKSVLLKEIAYLWATNMLLVKSNFLFLLHLRDPAVQQMKSLDCLVHHFYKYDHSCAAHLLQDGGKSVTILLDGYDEFPSDLRQKCLIVNLLKHQLLPASVIVISSRPHASTHLHDSVTCRVEILGFSEEDQTHFIQKSLEGKEKNVLEVKKYLKTHPIIVGLCFVPLNMTILLFLYKLQTTLPTSSAEMFTMFICITICRHLSKSGITLQDGITDVNSLPHPYSNIIQQLSQFAFNALGKNQLIFSLAEIKEHCPAIADYPNGFGLLQAVEYVGLMSKIRSFNFIHLTVQEYLAALYVSNLPPSEQLYLLKEFFWSNIYQNMFSIYVALTKGQHPSFKKFLAGGNDDVLIDAQFLNSALMCVRLYQCFYEAGDRMMCSKIEERYIHINKVINLSSNVLSPNDLTAVTSLLTCSSIKNWKELNLNSCHIQDYGIRLIHHSLMGSGCVTIEQIKLRNSDLSLSSDSYLSEIAITCKVKVLGISGNKVVGGTEQVLLSSLLTHPPSCIEQLYMYNSNCCSNRWAIELFTLLRDNKVLKELWIDRNNVSNEACPTIIDAFQINDTLTRLNLYGNPISGEAVKEIVSALKDNDALEMLWLPNYSKEIEREILSLVEIVNKNRRRRGGDVKLCIKFAPW